MGRAVSIRLDEEALRALSQLEASGLTRSQAVRQALIDAARRAGGRRDLAREAAALEADEQDGAEMSEVAAVMESLRAPG